jgi:hypothetical protein
MSDVTVLIPYAPEHAALMKRATHSAQLQSYPCDVRVMEDTDHRGAGWTRNRLLTQVTTEYVFFLDADDWLEPNCMQRCHSAMPASGYVYTDWYVDNAIRPAPDKVWCKPDTWHLISCLCRTDDVLRVGGFDEHLDALEDTDFWLKMNVDGVCGQRVAAPLVHYSGAGLRSQQARASGRERHIKRLLMQRYGGLPVGCCGQAEINQSLPEGEKQPGDVLAMALWSGNHVKRGLRTGRRYPRMSYPRTTWMAQEDVKADSRNWRLVPNTPIQSNGQPKAAAEYQNVEGFAQAAIDAGMLKPPPEMPVWEETTDLPSNYKLLNGDKLPEFEVPQSEIAPDWVRLVELGAARYE